MVVVADDERFIATSREELAMLFGRSVSLIQKWAAKGMPGEVGRYDLGEVLRWREQQWEQRLAVASGDPLLVDPEDTPGLERYRLARAEHEELKVAKLRETMVAVDDVLGGLLRGMDFIRAAGDELQQRFGPDAHRVIDGAIDNAIRMFQDTMGDASDSGSADNDAA